MTEPGAPELRNDHVAQLVSALAANGFPRMPAGALLALMASEGGTLTAEQLGEQLTASPAAVSGAVRYLTTLGMIRRHLLPGSRRYVYELPEHPWYTVSVERGDLYGYIAGLAEGAAAELQGRASDRMAEMADFFRFAQERMPALLAEWVESRDTGRS